MDIIMPVAGLGTRLRPQTWTKPKPLVSVAGKPMLSHVLERIRPLNPEKIIFITGFLGAHIEEWARANIDIPVVFVEQPEMKGQTDAIIRARDLARKDALILFPDMLFEADFTQLAESDADVVMFTKEVEDPSALGIAVVEHGRIVKLIEKPQEPISNLAVIGIYYIRSMPDLYAAIEDQMERGISLKNEYFIADAIQIMIDRGAKVVSMPVTAWEDCGNVPNLLSTNRFLLAQGAPDVQSAESSVIVQPSVVAPDATIVASIVGPYASIGRGAIIRNSIVKDSIVEDRALVEDALVEGSLVGRRAHVRGVVRSANIGDDSVVSS